MSHTARATGLVLAAPAAATPSHDSGLWATLQRRLGNWRRRGRLARLEVLDDRVLEDIGLRRDDLIWARYLPLDRDPLQALNGVAVGRRRAQRDLVGTRLARRIAL